MITHDVVELRVDPNLRWNPEPENLAASRTVYGMSTNVKLRREVSCLEFSFKPLRMIDVDVPQPSGRMQRKLIWYMVYRVRQYGPGSQARRQGSGRLCGRDRPGRARFASCLISSLKRKIAPAAGEQVEKAYLDRVIPAAIDAIRHRELQGRHPLLNSVEMAEQDLRSATNASIAACGAWPCGKTSIREIDFFSVYVGGLTNAYRWDDPPGRTSRATRRARAAASPARRCSSISGVRATIRSRTSGKSATASPRARPISTASAKALPTSGFTGRIRALRLRPSTSL